MFTITLPPEMAEELEEVWKKEALPTPPRHPN
jgi:hypothetical protein